MSHVEGTHKRAVSAQDWFMLGVALVILYTGLILSLVNTRVEIVEVPVPFAVEQPVIVEQVPYQVNAWYTSDDLYVLAEALYFESSIESLDCQAQVGYTVLNRVKKRKQSIRQVIWANKQFSYTQDGKHERMTDQPARERAFAVSKLVLNGWAKDRTQGGEYFVNLSIVPNWKFKDAFTKTITCDYHTYFKG
jgi:hypothetical protein